MPLEVDLYEALIAESNAYPGRTTEPAAEVFA
jgi:hypothetical protein